MNIWLLTGEYPPDYGGGIATYCIHTVKMLRQRGHILTVFAPSETCSNGWQIEEPEEGLKVVRFAANQRPQSASLGTFARLGYDAACVLADYCRKEGPPDVLESQEYLGLPYFLLQRRYLLDEAFTNIPVLVTAHTPLSICRRYDRQLEYRFPAYWSGEMERFSLLAADAVVYPSAYLLSEVDRELPQIGDRSRVIANPYQEEIETVPGLTSGRRKGFLFTAKIERRKGIEPLLTAFSHLWDHGLEEPLYLLGDDWFDELHQRNMSEALNRRYQKYIDANLLCWQGKQKPQAVKEKLGQVRAMILPSLFENYPYAVLEAMASGCPVIVSQSGGHAEIVENGINGYIFSHDKAGDLERQVQAMLDLSEREYARMSAAAQLRVKQISAYDVVAPQKEAAYEWARAQIGSKRHFPFISGKQLKNSPPAGDARSIPGLLSVVIPFYNLGDYLEDTLKSFSGLKDLPFELIIVDDGSTDEQSLRKLDELQSRYSFRLMHKENQGLAAARNSGAEIARGEFLAFIDSDDCMAPEFYRRAIRILQQYENVHYVGCWAEYFGDSNGYWPTWTPEPPYILVHNTLNTSALVYHRADFLRYGENDPNMDLVMEDYDSLLCLLENGCCGVAIPEPYYKYRVRGKSMSHEAKENVRMSAYQKMVAKHSGLYSQFVEGVVGLIDANGPEYLYDNPTLWYPAVDFVRVVEPPPGLDLRSVPTRMLVKYLLRSILRKPYRVVCGVLQRIGMKIN